MINKILSSVLLKLFMILTEFHFFWSWVWICWL